MFSKKNILFAIIINILLFTGCNIAQAAVDNSLVFKDENMENALKKYYNWEDDFTKETASELSEKSNVIQLGSENISNIEGIQYFDNAIQVNLDCNNLDDLKLLTKMKKLSVLNISNNSIIGKDLEVILNKMGKIDKLDYISLCGNNIKNIDYLTKIGDPINYMVIQMSNNRISDITILAKCTNLDFLILNNNRIKDVTPLKNLKKLTFHIDLRDNCIIDYTPIKALFDEMYADFDETTGMDRYDFYTNPVNFKYNGKKIKFPYLTVYYKYQAYAEASPLFKALGGNAEYDKKSGKLTCKYDGNVLVFKDFSKKYTLNGKEKSLKYPIRRMQYDLAYVPVKDICEALGMEYNITKTRGFYQGNDEYEYAPKQVEISMEEKELG